MTNPRDLLETIYFAAVDAANPYRRVLDYCEEIAGCYRSGGFSRLVVIGFGKASPAMAAAMDECLGDIIHAGVVITKYGHVNSRTLRKIRILEAGHPVPDDNGCKAAAEIIDLLETADEQTMVVVLVSGGASSLFVAPIAGITLREKRETTALLLHAGADIVELNTVRKHLSRVKGGRLAEVIHPAATFSLILSDVIGDPPDVVASGPTAPDPTTYTDALSVLEKYRLIERVPRNVVGMLTRGERGELSDTPKEGSLLFRKVTNRIIGSNRLALEEARAKAEAVGIHSEILTAELRGEAREAGKWLARKALALQKQSGKSMCLVSGGETTVTVRGKGTGGRNMELALAFALEIEGVEGITLLSAGTDGTDGPTEAAGAFVDGATVGKARNLELDPARYLQNNDSYSFFTKLDSLHVTGPTGTNVMDLQLILVQG